jgi:phosphohistidine phosphatase SixA
VREEVRVIYLVRHAHAGKRTDRPDDHLRRLSPEGRRRAATLAARLQPADGAVVLSSPSTRCTETVEPLAARWGRPIMTTPALAEGARVRSALHLVEQVPDGSVLCTHGDVLGAVLARLAQDGTPVREPVDLAKGVVWALARQGRRVWLAEVVAPQPEAPSPTDPTQITHQG